MITVERKPKKKEKKKKEKNSISMIGHRIAVGRASIERRCSENVAIQALRISIRHSGEINVSIHSRETEIENATCKARFFSLFF